MIYLGSPYTHTSQLEVERRVHLTEQCTKELMLRGLPVFSPIVHCHYIATQYKMPTDAEYWEKYNLEFLRKSEELFVLCIDGWKESVGLAMEIGIAQALRIPTKFVNEWGDEVLP